MLVNVPQSSVLFVYCYKARSPAWAGEVLVPGTVRGLFSCVVAVGGLGCIRCCLISFIMLNISCMLFSIVETLVSIVLIVCDADISLSVSESCLLCGDGRGGWPNITGGFGLLVSLVIVSIEPSSIIWSNVKCEVLAVVVAFVMLSIVMFVL